MLHIRHVSMLQCLITNRQEYQKLSMLTNHFLIIIGMSEIINYSIIVVLELEYMLIS